MNDADAPEGRAGIGLGVAIAVAALAWDPSAHAADPKRVLALVVAVAAAAHALVASSHNVHSTHVLTWSWKLAISFLGLSALSAAWGGASAMLDLGTWTAAAICAIASASMGRVVAIRVARVAASTTGGLASAYALLTVLRGQHGFAVHAGQGNPNWLGLLIAITLPFSVDALIALPRSARAKLGGMRLRDLRERVPCESQGVPALLSVIVQPAALYASHSRVAWIATAFAATWLMWRARGDLKAVMRKGTLVAAIAAILVLGVVVRERHHHSVPLPATTTTTTTTATATSEVEDVAITRSFSGRKTIASRSLEASRREGLFGAGMGNFGKAYLGAQGDALAKLPVRSAARGFINATTAHNEPLQIAVESGPIAAIVFVLMLIALFMEHRRARDHSGDAAAASTIAIAVMSLGDSPLRQPALCLIFGLICALSANGSVAVAVTASPSSSASLSRLKGVFALAAATSLLLPATRAWLSTRTLEAAFTSPASERQARFVKATHIDPSNADAWLALGTQELVGGHADLAIAHLTHADDLSPNVAARVALGEAHLAEQSGAANAKEALKGALAFAPGSLRAQLAMAEAEHQLGHLDEARVHADAAHAVAPFDPHVRELVDRLNEDAMDKPLSDTDSID